MGIKSRSSRMRTVLVTLAVAIASLHPATGLGVITRVSMRPSDCDNCGIVGGFGKLAVKICGSLPEGAIYDFMGKHELMDCFNFSMQRVNTLDQLGLVVFHEGSDGGQLNWVEMQTSDGALVRCNLGQWMDDYSTVNVVPTRDCTISNQ